MLPVETPFPIEPVATRELPQPKSLNRNIIATNRLKIDLSGTMLADLLRVSCVWGPLPVSTGEGLNVHSQVPQPIGEGVFLYAIMFTLLGVWWSLR